MIGTIGIILLGIWMFSIMYDIENIKRRLSRLEWNKQGQVREIDNENDN